MAKLYCFDCGTNTDHYYVGTNPDNGQDLYRCNECDDSQEVDPYVDPSVDPFFGDEGEK